MVPLAKTKQILLCIILNPINISCDLEWIFAPDDLRISTYH